MCEICRSYPCNCHCPNYKSPKAPHYCSICDEGIYEGEEYIVNNDYDYVENLFKDKKSFKDFIEKYKE